MTHKSHVKFISFNATMLNGSLCGRRSRRRRRRRRTALIDQCAVAAGKKLSLVLIKDVWDQKGLVLGLWLAALQAKIGLIPKTFWHSTFLNFIMLGYPPKLPFTASPYGPVNCKCWC